MPVVHARVAWNPVQTIGVELCPRGEPRPCGGVGKNQSNQLGIGSARSRRTMRVFFLTRQRMRSLEVLEVPCENSAAIRGRGAIEALYCE